MVGAFPWSRGVSRDTLAKPRDSPVQGVTRRTRPRGAVGCEIWTRWIPSVYHERQAVEPRTSEPKPAPPVHRHRLLPTLPPRALSERFRCRASGPPRDIARVRTRQHQSPSAPFGSSAVLKVLRGVSGWPAGRRLGGSEDPWLCAPGFRWVGYCRGVNATIGACTRAVKQSRGCRAVLAPS